MNIKTETTIILTSEDVEQIVKEYLEKQGFVAKLFYTQLRTDYVNDFDTMEFDGFRVDVDNIEVKRK